MKANLRGHSRLWITEKIASMFIAVALLSLGGGLVRDARADIPFSEETALIGINHHINGAGSSGRAAAFAAGGPGEMISSSSTSCSDWDGIWRGTSFGIVCGNPETDTWTANCSGCSCVVIGDNHHAGINERRCTVSGNNMSCTDPAIACNTIDTPCTIYSSATISGYTFSGTFSGCNGITGTMTGTKQSGPPDKPILISPADGATGRRPHPHPPDRSVP